MDERVVGAKPSGAIDSGLVDLSNLSFSDAVGAVKPPPKDAPLGHALRRIIADAEDQVAAFSSALTSRLP